MKIVAFFYLAITAPAFGQLKWDNLEQTFAPKSQDKLVVAKYRFINAGTLPVRIDEVQTSCGCTTATLAKKEYAPGESGKIEAKFDFAGRIGHQEKWILVTTDSTPEQPIVLRLVVNIPRSAGNIP
jgi:Protein of unknown function (DUF1573)